MEFKINPNIYSEIFVVPQSVVKDNIRLASAIHLKVLLCVLSNKVEELTIEKIAEAINKDTDDVVDALEFWRDRGILIKDGEAPTEKKETAEPKPEPKIEPKPKLEKKQVPDIPIARPTHEQIAIRCQECKEFRELFNEAQMKLGKTIGYEGQSTLIMLHDHYDLPIEVILMLLEYAKSKGKTGYKFIASVGKEWSEKEIDSLESAEEYIKDQGSNDVLWQEFKTYTGAKNRNPTAKQKKFLTQWSKEMGFSVEMIILAYEISIDNTGKLSMEYMNKVLQAWHSKKIKTPEQAEKDRKEWSEKNFSSRKKQTNKESVFSSDASYDLDDFRKNAIGLRNYVSKTE